MPARSEGGWTLIELMIVMVIGLVLLIAVLAVWSGAAANETRNAERFESLERARIGLEQMTRDVREAVAVTGVTNQVLTLKLWTRDPAGASPSELHVITYNCGLPGAVASSYRCARTDVTAATAEWPVVDQLSSSSVFALQAGASNLEITLSVMVRGAPTPIVLHSGAKPRNCSGALSACVGP